MASSELGKLLMLKGTGERAALRNDEVRLDNGVVVVELGKMAAEAFVSEEFLVDRSASVVVIDARGLD